MGEARRRREAGLPPKGRPEPTPKRSRAWLGHVFNVPGLGKVERQVDGTYYLIGRGQRTRATHEQIAAIESHHRLEQRVRRERDAAALRALATMAAAQHTERADLQESTEPEAPDAA